MEKGTFSSCDTWPVIDKDAFPDHQEHGKEGQSGILKRVLDQVVGSPGSCSVHHFLPEGNFGWIIAPL